MSRILKRYPDLNFPVTDLSVRMEGGRPFVLDEVRKTFVALTPEEWVRQHMVQFLIHHN